MKPLDVRLREFAKQNKILLDVIEKDYAQSYVLAGLISQPAPALGIIMISGVS